MNSPRLKPRILLIEDDQGRIDAFSRWLNGTEFVLVTARSGGQALGVLSRGPTDAIAGILLDHDLSDAPLTDMDRHLSSTNVLPLIVRRVRPTTPVLIHSHNASKPVMMQRVLESARFSVTRIRFAALDQEQFDAWLEEVRDTWEPPG